MRSPGASDSAWRSVANDLVPLGRQIVQEMLDAELYPSTGAIQAFAARMDEANRLIAEFKEKMDAVLAGPPEAG